MLLIDLSEEVVSWKDYGFNGFCLDNDFLSNGYFYFYYVVDFYYYWFYDMLEYYLDSIVIFKFFFVWVMCYQVDVSSGFISLVLDLCQVLFGEIIDSGVFIFYEFYGAGILL